ncbi:hypothetical protein AX16_000872 [Volvariella volvacea WC 439]|nr:hypothetical protein AX16_000872 [Volvariella volvacea WC 439]
MLLAGVFVASFARSLASPVPVDVPASTIPSPVCVATAAINALSRSHLPLHLRLHTPQHPGPERFVGEEDVDEDPNDARIMAARIAEFYKGNSPTNGGSHTIDKKWTRTRGFFVQMGGPMVQEGNETYRVVEWSQPKIPAIREKEVKDRGKEDILAKSVVVLQTMWFVVQCVARRVEGLVLMELELVTLAFAALNVVTYVFWWDKLLNVEYPMYFDREGNRVDGPEEREEEGWYIRSWKMMSRDGSSKGQLFGLIFGPFLEMTNLEDWHTGTSVHPFYAAGLSMAQHQLAYHCASIIGWNFPFLTTVELWLWRASSLVLTVTPAFIPPSWRFLCNYHINTFDKIFGFLVMWIGAPLYISARLIILFIAFIAFRDLPDSAYENVQWSNSIPHID